MGYETLATIVLAAGDSRRMGRPKLLLPWGGTTVLGRVVSIYTQAGIPDLLVVTGGVRSLVEEQVRVLAKEFPIRSVHNPGYRKGGMLSSIQTGLKALHLQTQGAIIGLGDQPQIRVETVKALCDAFLLKGKDLVVPTVGNRRGHPWLVSRSLWDEILALPSSATPRDFLNSHTDRVEYILGDPSILLDLDTPDDYARYQP